MHKIVLLVLISLLTVSGVIAQDTGSLEFKANGEGFVREGFVSKDGWRIDFNAVTVALSEIRAYQTNPPYNPDDGELLSADALVGLAGEHIIDLAEGDENADTISIGTVETAPAGYFNALSWVMAPAAEGDMAGYSLVIDGVAQKDGETINFVIRVDETYSYTCGAFIGDARKGIVSADTPADVELTFHFDHIFGDAETPLDDSLNVLAPGFDMFAELATDGAMDVTLADLEAALSAENYQMLYDILPTLGHTGEGHCYES